MAKPGLFHFVSARIIVALFGLATAIAAPAQSRTFSLSGDWSNSTNPNGPWSYNQGSTPLPLVTDWNAAGTAFVGCNQPAWAPSNIAGKFLPALMKANSCTAKDLGNDPNNGKANAVPGDIVVHTVDGYNGNPANGVATSCSRCQPATMAGTRSAVSSGMPGCITEPAVRKPGRCW